jgi:predicted dehydrogenase
MIRIAMLSFWHVHAANYAKQVDEHPETELVAVWDEDPARGSEEAARREVPYYDSLDAVLAAPNVDGVVVNAPTNLHREVLVMAARSGKHIFTEKVIAATLPECQEVLDAVALSGVAMMVSLPRLNHGYTLAIQDILRRGRLGELTLARTRLSHNGATGGWLPDRFFDRGQSQGGALIDLGCHPMYLTRLFLGLPDRISAHFGYVTGKDVEDNAVAVLQYPNGALGIVEAGFVTNYSPFSFELHGTQGSVIFSARERQLLIRTSPAEGAPTDDWTVVEIGPDQASAYHQWIDHIHHGTRADENLAMALDLTRLMDAAYQSAQQNRSMPVI